MWDVFCRVIDNLGDIGVCWRFCADLAARGNTVRLWIDAPEALTWMVPGALTGGVPGVQVLHWTEPLLPEWLPETAPADVWIEAFACDPAVECIAALADRIAQGHVPPVWLNLEYMSAESYVERFHSLPSPVMSGPLKGQTKWFFYPGFTPATGGLLREPDLMARRTAFDSAQWLKTQGIATDAARHRVSLFCYEPPVLTQVLAEAANDPQAADWLIHHGRTAQAVDQAIAQSNAAIPATHCLPPLTQTDFDHLLWSCDLNFVRGEDSLVRALWAGQPFVWHIYPQHDNAHHAKLEAFLDWLQAPASLRRFHRLWNGVETPHGLVWPGWSEIETWRHCVHQARTRLLAQPDLTTQLLRFVAKKR